MTSIKKTAPKIPSATSRRAGSACGSAPKPKEVSSSCGGWVAKSTRNKKADAEDGSATWGYNARDRREPTVASCGGGPVVKNTRPWSGC